MNSDTYQTKVIDKGLQPCQITKTGIRASVNYSALQIAYAMLLAQLSTWGVLAYYKDVEVWGGYVSLDTLVLMEPEDMVGMPLAPHFGLHKLSLLEPDKIIDYIRENGPDLTLIVEARQVPLEQKNKRMRRTKTAYNAMILTEGQLAEWEHDRRGPSEILKIMTIDTFDIPNKEVPESNIVFGFLKLDIGVIIRHVYKQLDILHLLS